jgi:hypothetical protein
MLDIRPQFVHVIRYERDVVNTGMKKTVSRVDRSSRWWCAKVWQYWQVACRPGNALVIVLRPKSRNMVLVPFRAGLAAGK